MQPTKHMDPSEDQLITHIKDSLMSHEEPYVPGSWEKFDAENSKRKPLIFWIGSLSSVAALLMLATGLYFFINKTSDQAVVQMARTSPHKSIIPGTRAGSPDNLASAAQPAVRTRAAEALTADKLKKTEARVIMQAGEVTVRPAGVTMQQEKIKITDPAGTSSLPIAPGNAGASDPLAVNPAVTNPAAKKPPVKKPYSLQEFLDNESIANKESNPVASIAEAKEDKWEMGVLVASSFGNTRRLNMGYGVSMEYAISSKISLGSGISYNQFAASKDISASSGAMNNPSSGFAVARSTKDLKSVEAKVSGIDIPFGVKYHFSKSLYANIGVSAFAVIDQQQNNSYIEQKLVEREKSPAAGNSDNFATVLVAEKTTERAPEEEVNNDKYLGFYNFSFGYKQKISKSKSVSIEPFMKVPMKQVSKENLRLMGTGVRLKFDF